MNAPIREETIVAVPTLSFAQPKLHAYQDMFRRLSLLPLSFFFTEKLLNLINETPKVSTLEVLAKVVRKLPFHSVSNMSLIVLCKFARTKSKAESRSSFSGQSSIGAYRETKLFISVEIWISASTNHSFSMERPKC